MGRVPSAVRALIVCACALLFPVVKYVLSDPIYESPPGARQAIPQPPPRPKQASERFGLASDGGRVIVRRSGRWAWVWVESEGTSDCSPRGSLPNGYVFTEGPRAVRADGSFEVTGDVWNTWYVSRKRKALPHKLDRAPFHITYRITGRFESRGRARGTFERVDQLLYRDEVAQECSRRSAWTATRAR
jgi:hypothetical protein